MLLLLHLMYALNVCFVLRRETAVLNVGCFQDRTVNGLLSYSRNPQTNVVPLISSQNMVPPHPPQSMQDMTHFGPKHPSVAALRLEGHASSPVIQRSVSPIGSSSGPPPNSPSSQTRHSPISPTPVTVAPEKFTHGKKTARRKSSAAMFKLEAVYIAREKGNREEARKFNVGEFGDGDGEKK
ncbi:unnamed protein product [Soboliphyme baturini]|uniref:Uncharacterized protein n=1 Tax=Soboliphyme baturini TaxID=241478 RepID=A0A183J6J2_9BILA|nr:unnamed protein product [Soboliphyme baturini]